MTFIFCSWLHSMDILSLSNLWESLLAIFSHVSQLRNCQEEGNGVILDAVIVFLYLGGKVFRQALQNYLGTGKRWVWPIKVQAGETRVWETQGHKNFTSLDGTMFLSVSFIIFSKVLKKKKNTKVACDLTTQAYRLQRFWHMLFPSCLLHTNWCCRIFVWFLYSRLHLEHFSMSRDTFWKDEF